MCQPSPGTALRAWEGFGRLLWSKGGCPLPGVTFRIRSWLCDKAERVAQDTWGEGLLPWLLELIFRAMVPAQREGVWCLHRLRLLEGGKGGTRVWLFLPLHRSWAVNWRSLSGHKEKYQSPAKENNRSFHC